MKFIHLSGEIFPYGSAAQSRERIVDLQNYMGQIKNILTKNNQPPDRLLSILY